MQKGAVIMMMIGGPKVGVKHQSSSSSSKETKFTNASASRISTSQSGGLRASGGNHWAIAAPSSERMRTMCKKMRGMADKIYIAPYITCKKVTLRRCEITYLIGVDINYFPFRAPMSKKLLIIIRRL